LICALAFVAVVALVDFNVAFWGAAMRVWDEATGQAHDAPSGPVEPVAVPEMYRRQVEAVKA